MTRGRRFILQVATLPPLWLLASINRDLFVIVAGATILVGYPITITVAVTLVLLARSAGQKAPETLVEAADTASTLALVHTGVILPAAISLLRAARVVVPLPDFLVTGLSVFLAWSLIIIIVPALSWANRLTRIWLPMLKRG